MSVSSDVNDLSTPLTSSSASRDETLPPTPSVSLESFSSTESEEAGVGALGRPPSFADGYDSMGGIPARVLEPSTPGSSFTCHAFSRDGTHLATGETDGIVKLWTTTAYSCIAEDHLLFDDPVECLAFHSDKNDLLTGYDGSGNMLVFKLDASGPGQVLESDKAKLPKASEVESKLKQQHAGWNDGGDKYTSGIQQKRTMQLSKDARTMACSCIAWATRGNTIDILLWTVVHRFDDGEAGVRLLGLITNCVEDNVDSVNHLDFYKCFSLAENGKSLIAAKYTCPKTIAVYPRLTVSASEQDRCTIEEAYAAWGHEGAFLLVWQVKGTEPRISIYETNSLGNDLTTTPAIAMRSLDLGLVGVEAQMLEASAGLNDHLEVLVAEVSGSGRARVFLWDATNDTLKKEVNVALNPVTGIGHSSDGAPRDIEFDRGHSFCISRNGMWLGGYSLSLQTCFLLSVNCGTVSWMSSLPESLMEVLSWRSGKIVFDSDERKMVLFTENCLVAFAPASLNTDILSRAQTITLKDLVEEEPVSNADVSDMDARLLPAVINMSKMVSPEAFSEALCRLPRHKLTALLGSLTDGLLGGSESARIVSIGCAVSGHYLGCITKEKGADETAEDHPPRVKLCPLEPHSDRTPHDFPGAEFPLTVDSSTEAFTPLKLRFYPTKNGEDGMVLLPDGCQPSVIFCNLQDESFKAMPLEMEKCLLFCQSEDLRRMCLLGTDCVHILDLASQRIVRKIQYKINFCQTIEVACDGSGEEHYYQLFNTGVEQIVSDDGRSVILGWDSENNKSIIVTPSTEMESCTGHLQEVKDKVDLRCLITGNGQCTYRYENSATSLSDSQQVIFVSCVCGRESPAKGYSFVMDSFVLCLGNVLYRVMQSLSTASYSYANLSADGTVLTIFTIDSDLAPTLYLEDMKRTQFSLYCAVRFMPDYQRLRDSHAACIPEVVKKLVTQYGSQVFNGPPDAGRTIAQEAVIQGDSQMLQCITTVSKQQQIELALGWKSSSDKAENLLGKVLAMNSTNSIQHVINLIKGDLAPFKQAAEIVKDCFKSLSTDHREILKTALSNNSFVSEACQMQVHVDFLAVGQRSKTALHIKTIDGFLDWKNIKDPDTLEQKWRRTNKDRIQQLEKHGNASTVEASLRFVCIEDAAKTGMSGIIRPLLLQKVPAQFFEFDAVKWVILYKWHRIWKQRCLWSILQFGGFLGCFTGYAIMVGGSANLSDEDLWRQVLATSLMAGSFTISLLLFKEEMDQLRSFAHDGRKHFHNWRLGIQYYFSSRWNITDLVCCFLAIVLIPLFHCLELILPGHQNSLSAFVAIEAILAYVKVWYYAQPFERTGAQVLMIANIVQDSTYFLLLAFVALCGFALSLRTLLRHAATGEEQDPEILHLTDASDTAYNVTLSETVDMVQETFGTPWRSLETLFYALLGGFDPEVFHSAGSLSWLTSGVFILYLISIVIVLLNLLISTMGDTYDRVKSTEQAQLLMGRAKFIDACEAALSTSEREQLDKDIDKYICVLVDRENTCDEEPSDQWMGKLNAIHRSLRTNIQKTEQTIKAVLQGKVDSISQQMREYINKLQGKIPELLQAQLRRQEDRFVDQSTDTVQKQESRILEEVQTTVTEKIQAALEEESQKIASSLEGQVSENLTSAMQHLEERITKNVRRAMQEQEIRIIEAVDSRLVESQAQLFRMEETSQALRNQLDQLASLLQQSQEH